MKYLIFDTETTGLPKTREPAEARPQNWPHLVSLSWVLLDTDTNKICKQRHSVIRPDKWTIPDESVRIHGITQEMALGIGVDLFEAVNEMLCEPCDAWVAHNLEFDMGVIVNAVLWDLDLRFPVTPQKKLCTMRLSKNVCKIPGTYGYKFPKLKELYEHAFKHPPLETHLHNSLYDARILTEVIQQWNPLREVLGLHSIDVETTE